MIEPFGFELLLDWLIFFRGSSSKFDMGSGEVVRSIL